MNIEQIMNDLHQATTCLKQTCIGDDRPTSASALFEFGCVLSSFPDLDQATGGFWSKELVLLAACDDGGKTSLALNIAEHLAIDQRLPVVYFSTHMGAKQLITRILASTGRIALDNMRTGTMSEDEVARFQQAAHELQQSFLHIEEDFGGDFTELHKRAFTLTQHYGQLGLLVIDSLENLKAMHDDRVNHDFQKGCVLRECAALARELKCPTLVLLRLPETVELRADCRPSLKDLPIDAGALKYAQTILSIYRDDQYAAWKSLQPGIAEFKVLKNRFGHTSTFELAFLDGIAKFESLAFNE